MRLFQDKLKLYFIHFIGSAISGEEGKGSAFILHSAENTSSEYVVTLLG